MRVKPELTDGDLIRGKEENECEQNQQAEEEQTKLHFVQAHALIWLEGQRMEPEPGMF